MMKMLFKYALVYGLLMLLLLGVSFILNSSPSLRQVWFYPYLDPIATLCGIVIIVHAIWTVSRKVRRLPTTSVEGRKRGRIVVIVIGVILLIVVEVTEFIDFTIRREKVTGEAITIAGSSPLVQSAIGTTIRLGWPIIGTFKFNDTQGRADFEVPIIGPKGRGALLVTATKESGRWYITNEVVSARNERQTLNLPDRQKE
jgi:hypothetical protein